MVEVDSTYYSPPAESTATPVGTAHARRFRVQHQGVQPRSPDTRPRTPRSTRICDRRPTKQNLYPDDLPADAYEQVWERFLSALTPLASAGKLGAVLFQFPPWFTIRRLE